MNDKEQYEWQSSLKTIIRVRVILENNVLMNHSDTHCIKAQARDSSNLTKKKKSVHYVFLLVVDCRQVLHFCMEL